MKEQPELTVREMLLRFNEYENTVKVMTDDHQFILAARLGEYLQSISGHDSAVKAVAEGTCNFLRAVRKEHAIAVYKFILDSLPDGWGRSILNNIPELLTAGGGVNRFYDRR
jgi:hypothetical protein